MCTAQPQDARFRSRPSPPTLAWKLNWPSTWRIQGKKTPQQILFPSASLFLQLLSFFLLCIGFGHQMAGAEELGTCSEEQLPRSILRSICCGDGQEGPPRWPSQFSAILYRTAHLLPGSGASDSTSSYPAAVTRIEINYDSDAKRARAKIVSGMDEGKTFLRRYDQKREYMIREGEFPICRRSYLGEKMPVAEFPQSAVFRGIEKQGVEGALSEHWVQDDGFSRVHFYLTMDDCTPRLLVEEIQVEPGSYTPLMTYEFLSFRSYPPQPEEIFQLPVAYTHENCERHVGGFPYLHLFHHYLRY